MARTKRNSKLDTPSARAKLAAVNAPYWHVISTGCAIGYRKGVKGGTWLAKLRGDDGRRSQASLGAADDVRDADGLTCFTFAQAQEAARAFFARKARELAGLASPHTARYTVGAAIDDYFTAREKRGSKGAAKDRYAANARILPRLGAIEVSKLNSRIIRDWHQSLAANVKDHEKIRQRRATANRRLSILKAALNHAYHEGRAASDDPWRRVSPFREVDTPVVRYLKAGECVRLVNACGPALRNLVRGALLTGCRYGELSRMRAADLSAEADMITVRVSKSGKPRHIALNNEGQKFFASMTAGLAPGNPIFCRADGTPWGASHQQRPLIAASIIAKIDPPATFHILRHTYASTLAMKAVPMGVIAAQLGHSDTRMTEKHYAHFAPSYVADTVRAALPAFGIIDETNVVALTYQQAKEPK